MLAIAERLRRAREARGLSRRALSLKAGLSPAVVGQIERSDVENPATSTLSALARALDVTLDWLASGEGEDPLATSAGAAA